MAADIEKNTLVELEFEINRNDILHCRSLLIDTPASEEYIILSPIPVEHGYTFKPGDRIDLYVSLLNTGDSIHTLHIKTRVIQTDMSNTSKKLHLKKSGFARRISQSHFYRLRSNASILLEADNPEGSNSIVSASVHSVSLSNLLIATFPRLEKGSLWKGTLSLSGYVFNFKGEAEPLDDQSHLANEHSSTILFSNMTDQTRMELAKAIESVQTNYIQAHRGLTLHEVFDRSDIQDTLILEHLVPRSWHRVALDILELAGWIFLILASIQILLSLPPNASFFDRFFKVNLSTVWDQKELILVPFYLGAELVTCTAAFMLHQFIYYRGSTRARFSLWILSLLSLLVYLAVQSHL